MSALEKQHTVEELAEIMRTTPSTVHYWRHIGYGPKGRKIGRRVLYAEGEIQRFLDSLHADAPEVTP